jgi:tetratricopeptide (TPR) repeat protein
MAISYRRAVDEPCATCGVRVENEEWPILDRAERPSLWAAWRTFPGPVITCANGHPRDRDTPLILYDPADVYAILSPVEVGDGTTEVLLPRLLAALPADLREQCAQRIAVVPRLHLAQQLDGPRFNLGNFAPGAEQKDELAAAYLELRRSPAALDRMLDGGHTAPALRAALLFERAIRFARDRRYEEVIEDLQEALEFYERDRYPLRWALIHADLALAYHDRRLGSRRANVVEAARCAELALDVLDADRYPEDYAHAQIWLANAILDEAAEGAVSRGITAYQAALTVFNRHSYPRDWVGANNNLATAYLQRSTGEDGARAAVAALRRSLTVASPKEIPQEWARARMRLGIALRRLPEGRTGELRAESLAALRDAHEAQPDHATGFNLGIALADDQEPELAYEGVGLLTEARRRMIETGDKANEEECRRWLVRAVLTCLHHGSPPPRRLARRALEVFAGEQDAEPVGVLLHELARRLNEGDEPATDLAERAARQALLILRRRDQAESRVKALANLGMILVRRPQDAQPARDCFEAALRLAGRLPDSPHRNELIGNIHIQVVGTEVRGRPGSLMPGSR